MAVTTGIVRNYRPDVFHDLNEFEVSVERLDSNYSKLPVLGEVIRKHGLQATVAISLLHKHFDLAPSEYLVKRYSIPTVGSIRPRVGDPASAIPYLWKVEIDRVPGEGSAFYPLEFMGAGKYSSKAVKAANGLTQATDFLSEMAERLVEQGVSDTFGIATLHSLAWPKEGESWQETTDEENRILNLRLAEYEPDDEDDEHGITVQTLYRAPEIHNAKSPSVQPAQDCWSHCNRHGCVKHQICRKHKRKPVPTRRTAESGG